MRPLDATWVRFATWLVVATTSALSACTDRNALTPPQPTVAPIPSAATSAPHPSMSYPHSRTDSQVDLIHGVSVPDPFRWLEDPKSPEVQAWMKAQDSLARGYLGKLPEHAELTARLKELMYVDAISAPTHRRGRYFFTRRHADREKVIVYWKQGKDGPEHVLLDPNGWSTDGSVSLSGWQPSWDGKLVAYKKSQKNSDEATLYVMEVDTGAHRTVDTIAGAKYASPSWTPSSDGFYYTWLPTDATIPASERPGYQEVRFHRLGSDPANDSVIHPRTGDPTKFLDASVSRDGRWLLLNVHHGWSASDAYLLDRNAPASTQTFRPIATGGAHHYYPVAYRGQLYVHTDDGASRYRVVRVNPERLDQPWVEVVPEHAEGALTDLRILGGRLALHYIERAASQVEIREMDGRLVRRIELPTLGTVEGPIGLDDEDDAFFGFDSFTTPPTVYETSIRTGVTTRYAQSKVPIDATGYTVEQVFYPSKDGTRISMFVVAPRGFRKDGSQRLLLTGYGGFQISETPEFRATLFPWLERGGAFALPNLRGGGEYGEQWHKDGMGLNKQNTFDDFIAAAEYLVAQQYTRSDRLVIRGASNGGLLVGAAMTQRPELFAAVLCGVPLLDMVRFHRFASGKTWVSEYGSADDPALFRVLLGYSPYHHVQPATHYPPLLVLSADSDDRVDPMHARKFAAAMQAASTGGRVLLRIESNAGHSGADSIKATVEKMADEYAFALSETAGQ